MKQKQYFICTNHMLISDVGYWLLGYHTQAYFVNRRKHRFQHWMQSFISLLSYNSSHFLARSSVLFWLAIPPGLFSPRQINDTFHTDRSLYIYKITIRIISGTGVNLRKCTIWYVLMFNNAEGRGWGRRCDAVCDVTLFKYELTLIGCGLCSLWCHWGVTSGRHWLVTVNMTFRLPLSTSPFFSFKNCTASQSYGALEAQTTLINTDHNLLLFCLGLHCILCMV